MNHNDIRHMLSEYIDGAVLPEDRAAIEEHLKTCEKCAEALKELRQAVAHIKSVEEIDPPAWMTQKIMAKVRVEAGEKSWFQRFFFPLHIKLPLEAIGVLFIAVTALFIYQNMQPSMKASKPQLQDHAPAKEPPAVIARNEEHRSAEPSLRSKDLPQSPGYKALDMKQEYEKPAQPMLESQAATPAPSPSKPAEQPAATGYAAEKKAYTADSENYRSFLSKDEASRGMMQERATTSTSAVPEATVKAKPVAPAAPIAGTVSADKTIPVIIVKVKNVEAAVAEVEKAISQVNGSIVRRELPGSKMIFFVTIKAQRAAEFKNKLKLLGEIKEQPGEWESQKEQVELRIEIIRKAALP
jgi:hypothetical protein